MSLNVKRFSVGLSDRAQISFSLVTRKEHPKVKEKLSKRGQRQKRH